VLPQYCGTLLEQCLMLNRRRNNLEDVVKSTRSGGAGSAGGLRAEQNAVSGGVGQDVTADDSVSIVESIISETERLRIREGVHTRIYVCATMWHETANEMVQVLKSIMRYPTLALHVDTVGGAENGRPENDRPNCTKNGRDENGRPENGRPKKRPLCENVHGTSFDPG